MIQEIITNDWWPVFTAVFIPIAVALIPYFISRTNALSTSSNVSEAQSKKYMNYADSLRFYVTKRVFLSSLEKDLLTRSIGVLQMDSKPTDFIICSAKSLTNIESIKNILKLGLIEFNQCFYIPSYIKSIQKFNLKNQIKYKIILEILLFLSYCFFLTIIISIYSIDFSIIGISNGIFLKDIPISTWINFLGVIVLIWPIELMVLARFFSYIKLFKLVDNNKELFIKKSDIEIEIMMLEKAIEILGHNISQVNRCNSYSNDYFN